MKYLCTKYLGYFILNTVVCNLLILTAIHNWVIGAFESRIMESMWCTAVEMCLWSSHNSHLRSLVSHEVHEDTTSLNPVLYYKENWIWWTRVIFAVLLEGMKPTVSGFNSLTTSHIWAPWGWGLYLLGFTTRSSTPSTVPGPNGALNNCWINNC